jgi:hypothetical protein
MGEAIAAGRIIALAMIANDMQEVKDLADNISKIKRGLELLEVERSEVIARFDQDITEAQERLKFREEVLAEVAGRLDRTLFEMYQVAPVGGVAQPKAKASRGKKATEVQAEPIKEAAHEATEAEAATESGTAAEVETVLDAFLPLTEPLGSCELCGGLGVIEGTLYGEPAAVPCNCAAGAKVAGNEGEKTVKCCDDCNIEDPDCASCHLPDMDAAPELEEPCKHHWREVNPADMSESCKDCGHVTKEAPKPVEDLAKCFNRSCTAAGEGAKNVCLRVGILGRAPQDCKNFKGEAEPVKSPELTDLQKTCPHPKPFREMIEGVGVCCKVCSLVVEPVQVAAPAVEVIQQEKPIKAACVGGCSLNRLRWESDVETRESDKICMDCGTVHARRDKNGKDIPL